MWKVTYDNVEIYNNWGKKIFDLKEAKEKRKMQDDLVIKIIDNEPYGVSDLEISKRKDKTMPKLYCARIECKYNENQKCKAETVNLGTWYGNTINEGYQEFSRCRTYEDSEYTIRVKKILAELKGENKDSWFAEMEEAEKHYEHEKWVESLEEGKKE